MDEKEYVGGFIKRIMSEVLAEENKTHGDKLKSEKKEVGHGR